MRSKSRFLKFAVILLFAACSNAHCGRVTGEISGIVKNIVKASFPVPVKPHSIMIIPKGKSESVVAMAVSDKCTGRGPYTVTGKIYYVANGPGVSADEQDIYVDSLNTEGVVTTKADTNVPKIVPVAAKPVALQSAPKPTNSDLKLYYYAAGQNVGYGALGLGYNRTLKLSRGIGIEIDGGITGIGNINDTDRSEVDTEQLIKSLNGRLKMDFGPSFGIYSGYRWNEGRGDQDRWNNLSGKLQGKDFVAPSSMDSGTVLLQGIEYGVSLRSSRKMSLSVGYIPKFRADYGSMGVLSEPGYTGELKFGTRSGAIRLRGVKSPNYWLADLGITIR